MHFPRDYDSKQRKGLASELKQKNGKRKRRTKAEDEESPACQPRIRNYDY